MTGVGMRSFSTFAVSLLLLFLAPQLPGQARANPMYNVVSNADLVDFKVGPGTGAQPGPKGLPGTGSVPLDF